MGPPKSISPIEDFGTTLSMYIQKAAPMTFDRLLTYFSEKTVQMPAFGKMPMVKKKSSGKVYDYDEEGRKLLAKANLQGETAAGDSMSYFYMPSVVYVHPETRAKLFIGGQEPASNKAMLEDMNIYHIVNC